MAADEDLGDFQPSPTVDDDADRVDGLEPDTHNPYRIADPVVDLAQGRPMIVVDAPEQVVHEWSEANGYDLMGNYANSKFDPDVEEPVVECVYVSDVRSEPSKTYTFPVSRVALIDVHHADGGLRLYDRVAVDILDLMFRAAESGGLAWTPIKNCAIVAGLGEEAVDEAWELAEAAQLGQEADDD